MRGGGCTISIALPHTDPKIALPVRCSCDVVYKRRADADAAIAEFDGRQVRAWDACAIPLLRSARP